MAKAKTKVSTLRTQAKAKPKAFKQTARAEIKIRKTSDRLIG